jgi:hypothetical protein
MPTMDELRIGQTQKIADQYGITLYIYARGITTKKDADHLGALLHTIEGKAAETVGPHGRLGVEPANFGGLPLGAGEPTP